MAHHKSIVSLLCFVLVNSSVLAHVYRSGAVCPRPNPVVDFDMTRFLGRWYVLQKSRMSLNCLVYNITREVPDEVGANRYRIEQITYFSPSAMGMRSGDSSRRPHYKLTYAGKLWAPDGIEGTAHQSHMNVQFPLNMIGDSTFDIFATDYTNFAGVFSCQPLLFLHRQSATFMSRTRTLSADTLKMLRYRLYDNDINGLGMTDVGQADCGNYGEEDTADVDDIDIRAADTRTTESPTIEAHSDIINFPEEEIEIRVADTKTKKTPTIDILSDIRFPDEEIEPIVSKLKPRQKPSKKRENHPKSPLIWT